jgi:hypothetical protein
MYDHLIVPIILMMLLPWAHWYGRQLAFTKRYKIRDSSEDKAPSILRITGSIFDDNIKCKNCGKHADSIFGDLCGEPCYQEWLEQMGGEYESNT